MAPHMDKAQLMDREKLKLNLARMKKGGENFEIVIDPDKAMEYKESGRGETGDILKSETIFSDAQKGLEAPEQMLESLFGTSDPSEVAGIILREGDIQLTAEYRARVREMKKKRILDIIHKNSVDPGTGLPHPVARIESAFDQSNAKVDEFKGAEIQVDDIVKSLRPIIPIKFEIKEMEVRIPAEHASKTYGMLKRLGNITSQKWENDGSLFMVIDMPGGMETDFYDKVNALTHGNNRCRVLRVK